MLCRRADRGHPVGRPGGDGLGAGVPLGPDEGVGGGVVGDGRATVGAGVGAVVAGAAEVAGGVTVTGVQAARAIRATADNRRRRSLTARSV